MAQLQQLNKAQLRPHVIDASHIDITTVGKSVITKLIPTSGLFITSTGVDDGTGEVTLKLDTTLSALAELNTLGFLTRLSNDKIVTRTFGFSNSLTITHQNGNEGNPIFDLSDTGIIEGVYKYLTVDSKGRASHGYKYLQTWVANEILADTGNHITYNIANTPVDGTIMVFLSGNKQVPGADQDYILNGNQVVFNTPCLATDVVTAAYFWNESGINIHDILHETLTPFNNNLQRYRLGYYPQIDSQVVFLNGLAQQPGIDNDYTMDGQDVVFNTANYSTDKVTVLYFR